MAHIFLSHDQEQHLLGNFIADFVGNKELIEYDEKIIDGIMLHRKIDSFTDNHDIVREGTRRLRKTQGKYAPVVIDIIYDYFLCQNWSKFSDESIHNFRQKSYRTLSNQSDKLSERIKLKVDRMIDGDFLSMYESLEGMRFVFEQMDKRTKFPSKFVEAAKTIENHYDEFNDEFLLFFPEINKIAKQHLGLIK